MVKGKKRNKEVEFDTGLKGRSGRVVVAAICMWVTNQFFFSCSEQAVLGFNFLFDNEI